jgi:hypothetical protein
MLRSGVLGIFIIRSLTAKSKKHLYSAAYANSRARDENETEYLSSNTGSLSGRCRSSGSLAMLRAIRRASSWVNSLDCGAPSGLTLEIDIRERLPVVADAEALAGLVDGLGRREAAVLCNLIRTARP